MSVRIVQSEPYPLGRGFSVEFRLDGLRMDAIWSPDVPFGRRGRQLLPAYRAARNAFLTAIAADMDTRILCVEPGEGGSV